MITHSIGPIESAYRAAAIDRRRRLMGKTPARKPVTVQILPVSKARVTWFAPVWRVQEVAFDDHVTKWHQYKAGNLESPIASFMRGWCATHFVSVDEMVGQSRYRKTAQLRHMLVYEIYRQFSVSLPQLGRIFGGRDHTTILNSIRRAESMLAAIETDQEQQQ